MAPAWHVTTKCFSAGKVWARVQIVTIPDGPMESTSVGTRGSIRDRDLGEEIQHPIHVGIKLVYPSQHFNCHVSF